MAAEDKPRIYQGGWDMILSLAVIIVAMVVAVGATGLCSYEPGTPEGGPVREVDAESFMGLEARATDYPLYLPESPEGWVTNSARRSYIGDTPAPVVGWVTADQGYIQLTQTDQSLEDAVKEIDADPRELDRTFDLEGYQVEVYQSEYADVRDLWVVDHGDSRLLFSGAAFEEDFRTIISATLLSEPLPSEL
ncbi:DUF4245 domain-containing protein [Corynebacterium alimapuense]|uniref:DUF4245 domain-containing protein n=1 Tax=Corynebacterium alimapuense TaxID=1576874 RepID=A0A3M8K692_9CORY|nr:DUF4245 domain-containing protein [Corynebacterium alimapuense]RNE48686.1 DUF4245 domain-containing protein [Corynebacterium alimapuense]